MISLRYSYSSAFSEKPAQHTTPMVSSQYVDTLGRDIRNWSILATRRVGVLEFPSGAMYVKAFTREYCYWNLASKRLDLKFIIHFDQKGRRKIKDKAFILKSWYSKFQRGYDGFSSYKLCHVSCVNTPNFRHGYQAATFACKTSICEQVTNSAELKS